VEGPRRQRLALRSPSGRSTRSRSRRPRTRGSRSARHPRRSRSRRPACRGRATRPAPPLPAFSPAGTAPAVTIVIGSVRMEGDRPNQRVDDAEHDGRDHQLGGRVEAEPDSSSLATHRPSAVIAARSRKSDHVSPSAAGAAVDVARMVKESARPTNSPRSPQEYVALVILLALVRVRRFAGSSAGPAASTASMRPPVSGHPVFETLFPRSAEHPRAARDVRARDLAVRHLRERTWAACSAGIVVGRCCTCSATSGTRQSASRLALSSLLGVVLLVGALWVSCAGHLTSGPAATATAAAPPPHAAPRPLRAAR